MIRFFKYLYFSNLITSFSGAFLSFGIINKLKIQGLNWYPWFLFFAVLVTYTYQRWRRYLYLIDTKSEHIQWINSNKLVHFFIFIVGILGSLTFILFNFQQFIKIIPGLLVPSIISIWYVHPFCGIILREVPYIKSFLIVFTWIALVLWIPCYLSGVDLLAGLHQSVILFFFLFGILLLFDLRDIDYDAQKIKTFPILIGEKYTKILVFYCFFLVVFYGLVTGYIQLVEIFPICILLTLVFFARPKGPTFYFACLDLLLAVQGLFYVIFH